MCVSCDDRSPLPACHVVVEEEVEVVAVACLAVTMEAVERIHAQLKERVKALMKALMRALMK